MQNKFIRQTKIFVLLILISGSSVAQDLPARWDELTAGDWPRALERSAQTCILPIGILEKHGPHAPIGSDLIHVREWAAQNEFFDRVDKLKK
jgi:creatinine amidohydrolase